jgi:BlaI family transcriptional regulator, penicillinase repressor
VGDHAVRRARVHWRGREARPPGPRRAGELSGLVLDVLAQAGHPLTTREVLGRLQATGAAPLAYNTVRTVLSRLYAQGGAGRSRAGQAHAYAASAGQAQLAAQPMHRLLDAQNDRPGCWPVSPAACPRAIRGRCANCSTRISPADLRRQTPAAGKRKRHHPLMLAAHRAAITVLRLRPSATTRAPAAETPPPAWMRPQQRPARGSAPASPPDASDNCRISFMLRSAVIPALLDAPAG